MPHLTLIPLLLFIATTFLVGDGRGGGSGGVGVDALVTYDMIRRVTVGTDEVRQRIGGVVGCVGGEGEGGGVRKGQRVLVLGSGDEEEEEGCGDRGDGGEIEDIIATALHKLCTSLHDELSKPLINVVSQFYSQPCNTTTHEHHAFLSTTVHLIRTISDIQTIHHWNSDSAVFESLAWMQRLWASRSANIQQKSFIEQQLSLYNPTTCFSKNEVLRRGVEVVEYVNDVIDGFR